MRTTTRRVFSRKKSSMFQKYIEFSLTVLILAAYLTSVPLATGETKRGYALCAFTATYTPKHIDYGDERGAAWVDVVFFEGDDPIPTEREMEEAFADHVRAGRWVNWNPWYDNESVDCKINRNAERGQGRRNEKEWEARFRSEGWKVLGIGGIYWWNSKAGRSEKLLIQNSDWRGPVRHH